VPHCAPGGIAIAPARWNEAFTLFQLSRRVFGSDAHPFIELLGQLTLPGYVHLKASDRASLVGLAFGEVGRHRDAAWIIALGVLPAYRSRGVGATLLAACEGALAFPVLRLCVRVGNHPAIALYERSGYRNMELIPRYYLDGGDAYLMEKQRPA